MPTSITTGFDFEQHALDGNGWVNSYDNGAGTIISANFATLTLAHAAAQDILSDDASIHQVLLTEAQQGVLTTNAAAVTTAVQSKRTAEGLDAPFP
jgi:hypothetical protein